MVRSYRPGEERAATRGCLSKLLHMMFSLARVSILPFSVSFFFLKFKMRNDNRIARVQCGLKPGTQTVRETMFLPEYKGQ